MDYQNNYQDIFQFDPNFEYEIVLLGGIVLKGMPVEAYDNGIVINTGQFIPTASILYFSPVMGTKNETTK